MKVRFNFPVARVLNIFECRGQLNELVQDKVFNLIKLTREGYRNSNADLYQLDFKTILFFIIAFFCLDKCKSIFLNLHNYI